jgi:hypothetical protein
MALLIEVIVQSMLGDITLLGEAKDLYLRFTKVQVEAI